MRFLRYAKEETDMKKIISLAAIAAVALSLGMAAVSADAAKLIGAGVAATVAAVMAST